MKSCQKLSLKTSANKVISANKAVKALGGRQKLTVNSRLTMQDMSTFNLKIQPKLTEEELA